MKKEYIILLTIILGLSAYLVFHKENRSNYTLPAIDKVDTASVTAIHITKNGTSVQLARQNNSDKNKTWTVSDQNYPADTLLVESMLDTLKTFKLTALVSQTSDLKRYDLDLENQIHVIFETEDKKKTELTIGKEAPSFNHTFVMLKGDKNVYHASGSFRHDFDKEVSDLRDNLILEVKADTVKQFTISKGQASKTLIASDIQNEKGKNTKSWATEDKTPADSTRVKDFLAAIAYLKSDSYPEDQSKREFVQRPPTYEIKIDNGKELVFSLFKKADDKVTYGISTQNDYLFTLSDFDTKEITSNIDSLLGLSPEKNK